MWWGLSFNHSSRAMLGKKSSSNIKEKGEGPEITGVILHYRHLVAAQTNMQRILRTVHKSSNWVQIQIQPMKPSHPKRSFMKLTLV